MSEIRLLIVDDDEVDRKTIWRRLGGAGSSFVIREASSVAAGMEALSREVFNCVLVDFRMPDGDGLDMIRAIRKKGLTGIALILLTGFDDESIGMTALREGAQDFLVKGKIDTQILTRSIRYAVERERMDREMRDQTVLLETILKQTADGILVCDVDTNITFANNAARRLTGMIVPGVNLKSGPRPWGNVLDEEGKELPFEEWPIVRAVKGDVTIGQLILMERPDGPPLHLSVSAVPLIDSHRNPMGAVASFADVTRQRQTELRKRELEGELNQSKKMESIGRLAGGVAHDFNNLLTVISGYGSLLKKAVAGQAETEECVEEILKAAESASMLTRQLLAYSRKQVLKPRVVDLNEVVVTTQTLLERLIRDDIDMQVSLAEDACPVVLDPGQIQQVLINLAVNAQDAMPSGGMLTIETQSWVHGGNGSRNGYCILTVTDTGTGMDPETVRKIFEPFFTTKEQGKGTGLGLASVYGIVKQSGGEIRVDSEPGKGTRFTVSFPRSQESTKRKKKPGSDMRLVQASQQRGERILLVEDSPVILGLVRKVLASSGFEVVTASNGEEGVKVAKDTPQVDLVISDMVMPKMGGKELIRQVSKIHPEARILYMSGYSEEALAKEHFLEAGSFFIEKPFTPGQLIKKVNEVMKGSG